MDDDPIGKEDDVESFLVMKHSWKGKYRRILAIGNQGVTTYNPDKLEMTNRWLFADIVSVEPIKNSNVMPISPFNLSNYSIYLFEIYILF